MLTSLATLLACTSSGGQSELYTEGVQLQQRSHLCVKAAWKEGVLLLPWLPA